ncbi:MAG: hypothetical protein A2Y63_04265 [Candidatus Riflebacteria bacterium RBG_13_59_9]|jgi:DNA-binding NarL/FixJ family response regulator|nr:MAG: hypothetical protein A2Y63_04265 [Candidatus Riflebacteria bacterium RBG_13_59_9]
MDGGEVERPDDHSTRARVLLADDHDLVLHKVGRLLDGEFDVIGKVRDGQALIDAAEWLRPDLLIVDISMPIMGGIEAAHRLMESGSKTKIVFLTVHEGSDLIGEALATGALGYVIKSRLASDLIAAARAALAGRLFISPSSLGP